MQYASILYLNRHINRSNQNKHKQTRPKLPSSHSYSYKAKLAILSHTTTIKTATQGGRAAPHHLVSRDGRGNMQSVHLAYLTEPFHAQVWTNLCCAPQQTSMSSGLLKVCYFSFTLVTKKILC